MYTCTKLCIRNPFVLQKSVGDLFNWTDDYKAPTPYSVLLLILSDRTKQGSTQGRTRSTSFYQVHAYFSSLPVQSSPVQFPRPSSARLGSARRGMDTPSVSHGTRVLTLRGKEGANKLDFEKGLDGHRRRTCLWGNNLYVRFRLDLLGTSYFLRRACRRNFDEMKCNQIKLARRFPDLQRGIS